MHTKTRILIADDEPDFLEQTKLYFEPRGYEVVAVADGARALELLGAEDFDVAILDLVMPGASGLDVVEASRRRGDDVGLILLTNYGERDDAIRAVNAHVDYWIEKPKLDYDDLKDKVDRLAEGVSLDEVRRMLGPQPPVDDAD
jgi:two-component system, OmpR family, response regulator ResD